MDLNKNPGDMPVKDFRKQGHKIIDWIADYIENLDQIPVLPDVQPGDIDKNIQIAPPKTGESMDKIFDDIDKIIMPGMTHWNHPNFMAYFSISSSGPAILGELLSAAFNANAMLWKTCPSATELETRSLNWLRQMLGLPDKFWGLLYDTASVSTLHAIAAAREQLELNIREKGYSGIADLPPLCLYTSAHAHSSVEKAAITLGIGQNWVRKIPVNNAFEMNPDELEATIVQDKKDGYLPFCTVGTVGTTSTTSVDPIPAIAKICQKYHLWLHVDAAYGGPAAIVPEYKHVLQGCELADSIVVNPHKWLFVPIDCSAFYTQKPDVLKQAFSLVPEYLSSQEQTDNLMDYGIQLGRRFRALKLWFVFRYFGWKGLAGRIQYSISLARKFAGWIDDDPIFERMAPTPFSTICFRAHPNTINNKEKLNTLNQTLLSNINKSRTVFLSHTKLHENYVLRMAIGNIHTNFKHIQQAWDIIQNEYQKLAVK
jgi:aromatic-L-amino-acid decarboxylase